MSEVERAEAAPGLGEGAPVQAMAPVAAPERITEIDVVRGFALLGILLMNIEYFGRPMEGLFLGLDRSLRGLDLAAGWFVMAFVQGKFYTLFSTLFGMGFAIQAERAERRGARFGRLFSRRLAGLALIGAIHGYLIWAGDILLVYAIVGSVLLLFFRRTPPSRLWKWALGFVLLVSLAQVGFTAANVPSSGDPATVAAKQAEIAANVEKFENAYAESADLYEHGSWYDLFPQRLHEMNQQLQFLPFFGWNVLAMFLLGAWLVKSGVMRSPREHVALFRRFRAVGLGVGAPAAVIAMLGGVPQGMAEMNWAGGLSMVLMLWASFALCFGYLGTFVLLAQSPTWGPRLHPVAQAGRMALTNYLSHSILLTTVCYGYGFGLFGDIPRAVQIVVTVAIWIGNLAFSSWWLARFRFGPAEWLWRSMTYGARQPMRREVRAAAT